VRDSSRKTIAVYLLWISAMVISCIDPIEIDVDSSKTGNIVISGLITDQPGPYKVELSLSQGFFDTGPVEMISDALVTVEDDLGKVSVLEESISGVYLTDEFELTGEVGRKYTLTVKLQDGRTFQSLPEELLRNPGMDAIYTEFKSQTISNDFNILTPKEGLEVFVDTNPSTINDQSFYRWRWVGTYEILTYPQLKTMFDAEIESDIPDSPNCSGMVDGVQVSDCTCCTCWIEEYSQTVLLGDSKFAVGGQKRVPINFIPIDEWRFHEKYHTYVEQISLTRSGYEFWKSVKDQQQQGTLFDPTLAIASNITAVNNEDVVLGYFGASSIKSISKFTKRSEIPIFISALEIRLIDGFEDSRFVFKESCLRFDENSTNIKPDFW
jgi:hypothetical protein